VMIAVSIGFGLLPMHLYNVVRSGVDPLVARITQVVPIAATADEPSRQPPVAGHQIASPRSSSHELTASQLHAEGFERTP